MENSVKSKKRKNKSHITVGDSSECNDENPNYKKSKKKQKIDENFGDENLEPSKTDLISKKMSKKSEQSLQEDETETTCDTKGGRINNHKERKNVIADSEDAADLGSKDDENPKHKKSKKKQKINENLSDENLEPPKTDSMSKKKSKKSEESLQKDGTETICNTKAERINKQKVRKNVIADSEGAADLGSKDDENPKYKKSNKKQKINENLSNKNLEPLKTDSMSKKKSKKSKELLQKAESETTCDTKAERINEHKERENVDSEDAADLGSKDDENPKHKKSKKKRKINVNLSDENLEPPKTDSISKKKSKKSEESLQKDETETTCDTKAEKINKHKVRKNVAEFGSKDDEKHVDSSSNDESDISDGESVKSVSSFNIDSYPSDDEDEDDGPSSDEEEANKKHGLPIGAVPSAELEEQENRTIFVGNLPKTVERHKLQKWFSRFGKVECVRLRSAPIADLEMPRKVAVIKKSFHENRSNIHAYIRYKDIEGAQNALQANCTKYGEYTLRVDKARHTGGYDGKKAVFVGNVPFTIEENSLISLFSKCGEIDGVRIIRDKQTGVGKGFAYVNFKCSSSVPLALKLDGEVLEKRALRVKPVKYNAKRSFKLSSNFSQKRNNSKFKPVSRQVRTNGFGEMKKNGPSSKPPLRKSKFQGEFSKRKEKTKFKKKSFATKKREIYSKILVNKKKTD